RSGCVIKSFLDQLGLRLCEVSPRFRDQTFETLERQPRPARSVIELISDFVEGLVKQVHPKKRPAVRGLEEKFALVGRPEIGGLENALTPVDQLLRPVQQLAVLVKVFVILPRCKRRIPDRTKHPGYIPHRKFAFSADLQGTVRLALEIQDVVVSIGDHDLPEMQIAMDADFLLRMGDGGDLLEALHGNIPLRRARDAGQVALLSGKHCAGFRSLAPDTPHERLYVRGGAVNGRDVRFARSGKRKMKLGRPDAEYM